jgi:hypothetical protein
MRTLKLIARFYRGIFLVNFFVTIVTVYAITFHRDQANKLIGTFFWGKIITIALIIYFAFTAKKKELYYYQNLGVSKQKLAITTGLFDFLLWLMLIVLAYRQ